jgi:hypothetical protein
MRIGISIKITRPDRHRLEAITKDRNASQKHVWRANIVLLSSDGVGPTRSCARQTGTSKTCVWHWQQRFMEEGVDGQLRDKTRPSRIPRHGPEVVERVVALTLADPPTETNGRRVRVNGVCAEVCTDRLVPTANAAEQAVNSTSHFSITGIIFSESNAGCADDKMKSGFQSFFVIIWNIFDLADPRCGFRADEGSRVPWADRCN